MVLTTQALDDVAKYFHQFLEEKYPNSQENLDIRKIYVNLYNEFMQFLINKNKTMRPDKSCYDLIKSWEGIRLKAYQDSAGIWTIGWGTIIYPNGHPVKMGETCTQAEADQWLEWEVDMKARVVTALTHSSVLKMMLL